MSAKSSANLIFLLLGILLGALLMRPWCAALPAPDAAVRPVPEAERETGLHEDDKVTTFPQEVKREHRKAAGE